MSSKEFSNKSIEFDEIKVIDHSLIRKPGNVSYDNITLKSVEIEGKELYEWLTAVQTSAANRVHIRIVHVGDDQNCLASWMLMRTYSIKVTLYNLRILQIDLPWNLLYLAVKGFLENIKYITPKYYLFQIKSNRYS